MSAIFIKGTVIGLSKNDWLSNSEYLTSTALLILQNWYMQVYNSDGSYKNELSQICRKQYGEVRQAVFALENDLHNLSIIYHQLLHFKSSEIDAGLKDLYFSNLTESYFTNLRSAYDHITCFPRISLEEGKLDRKVAKLSSFNELLGFANITDTVKRAKGESVYCSKILDCIDQSKSNFLNIKQVRDAIIHHGKEPVVTSKGDKILFRVPSHVGNYNSENILPNILKIEDSAYPLFEYLRSVTISLFTNMEHIGNSIGNEYLKNGGRFDYYYGLIGICMKDFIDFIFPDGKEDFFRKIYH